MKYTTKLDFGKTNSISEIIQKGTALLAKFLTDYQFDEEHEDYLGFLNVGGPLMSDEDANTFKFICDNPTIFRPIISAMGGVLENDRLDYTETIFHRKQHVYILKED